MNFASTRETNCAAGFTFCFSDKTCYYTSVNFWDTCATCVLVYEICYHVDHQKRTTFYFGTCLKRKLSALEGEQNDIIEILFLSVLKYSRLFALKAVLKDVHRKQTSFTKLQWENNY